VAIVWKSIATPGRWSRATPRTRSEVEICAVVIGRLRSGGLNSITPRCLTA
jgi:hypothetical protein